MIAEDVQVFEDERDRLLGLAYRMLGSVADAEDVVQDAWVRWERADRSAIDNPAAWLTTVVSRLGLDRLRARQRDRATYVGPWLPEPVAAVPSNDPAEVAEVSDSLTTAFLVLLERLSPEERLTLLLADVFHEPFATVAATLGKSEAATRQLAVRARRKVHAGMEGRRPAPVAEQRAVVDRFVGAVLQGDLAAVADLLTPDAVLVSDGGARQHAARRPVVGAERISRFVVNITRRIVDAATAIEPSTINQRPGYVVRVGDRAVMAIAFEVVDGRVDRTYSILNPDKLAALDHPVAIR